MPGCLADSKKSKNKF